MSSGLQDAAIQIAETIQTAHINKNPSHKRDLAPSTAADSREPVRVAPEATSDGVISMSSSAGEDEEEDALPVHGDAIDDEIPLSLLEPIPQPRRPAMPPLPDLRFEQSYLASIQKAQSWQGVTYITVRDQVFMPLIQGMTWTLLVAGWRHWNSAAKFGGQTVGARIRRWWWGVNGWKVPRISKATLRDEKFAEGIVEFYTAQSSVGGD